MARVSDCFGALLLLVGVAVILFIGSVTFSTMGRLRAEGTSDGCFAFMLGVGLTVAAVVVFILPGLLIVRRR